MSISDTGRSTFVGFTNLSEDSDRPKLVIFDLERAGGWKVSRWEFVVFM